MQHKEEKEGTQKVKEIDKPRFLDAFMIAESMKVQQNKEKELTKSVQETTAVFRKNGQIVS